MFYILLGGTGLNGSQTNCGIVLILGILLKNNSDIQMVKVSVKQLSIPRKYTSVLSLLLCGTV